MDSTVAVTQTVIDSTTAHGWLAPIITKFDFIPPVWQLVIVGALSWAMVDLCELAMVRLKNIKGIGPIIAWLLTRWAKNPRFVSPLILYVVSATSAGGTGIGVIVAAIAAGLRGIFARRNVMLNAQDKTKLTKLSHAAVILGALLLPSMAHALDLPKAAKNAWIQSQVNIGLENRWLASDRSSFRDVSPVPQAFGRWEVALPILRLAVHAEAGRRIDKERPWEARAGFSVRIK